MAVYAPERPTTMELEEQYPLGDAEVEIPLGRERVDSILSGRAAGFVGDIGGCALTNEPDVLRQEGEITREATRATEGLIVVRRLPPWKPRTNPESWWGLETSHPEDAYRLLVEQANEGDLLSMEIAHRPHLERYGKLLTMAWFGGRNIGEGEFMLWTAEEYPDLPLAVKNGLDGDIEPALRQVEAINDVRGDDGARAVLLYRGGENARNPQDWERQYRAALEATGGLMIVDVAHGTEMAHDPDGKFKKSVAGQIEALNHVLRIALERGELPAGLMSEATAAPSPVDPCIPHQIAMRGLYALNGLRMANTVPADLLLEPGAQIVDTKR